MTRPIKSGDTVLLDAFISGMIKVKILSIEKSDYGYNAKCKVMESAAGYTKGEVLRSTPRNLIPKRALYYNKAGQLRIAPYQIQFDDGTVVWDRERKLTWIETN